LRRCRNAIHAEGGWAYDHGVPIRFTKRSGEEINAFVTTPSHEQLIGRDAVFLCELFDERRRLRLRVSIEYKPLGLGVGRRWPRRLIGV
jgi:hypothetical protein